MTDPGTQSTYQVRLGWGSAGLDRLADAGVVVLIDAIPDASAATVELANRARALPGAPAVLAASLRNATATANAVYQEQLARGGRTAVNLVLVGDDGAFAVEDYLAAGAVGDALTALGIDHSAPDVAVAAEGFRALRRALKHLLSASATGLSLAAAGRAADVRAAAELDAETEALRIASVAV